MKVSGFTEAFNTEHYPELFSAECHQALKNISQTEYGSKNASAAIYEVHLNDASLTTDFSCRLYDEELKDNIWLEFDYENYASGVKNPPCIFNHYAILHDSEERMRKFLGSERYDKIIRPFRKLEEFAEKNKLRFYQLGVMDGRGTSFTDNIRIVINAFTIETAISLLKTFSYTGDIALIENTMRNEFMQIMPYVREKFELNFDLFPDGGISNRLGIALYTKFSMHVRDLMNFLVEHSFCLPGKAQDVINWLDAKLPNGVYSQKFGHMKFQFDGDKISTVKAYLGQSEELNIIKFALTHENFINFL